MKAGEFPELRLKAWTSRVITSFLSVALQDLCAKFTNDSRDGELAMAASATAKLAEWMLAVERCPRYMTQEQTTNVHRIAWGAVSWYVNLSLR